MIIHVYDLINVTVYAQTNYGTLNVYLSLKLLSQ